MKQQRKKALLGTLLGVGSIIASLIGAGTSIYSSKKQAQANADAMTEENKQNRINANINNTNLAMQNTNENLNSNNLNEYYDRFNTNTVFKCGGKRKMKSRKKGKFGLEQGMAIGSAISSIGNAASNVISANSLNNIKKEYYRPVGMNILGRNMPYNMNNLNNLPMYKQGGKKSCK